MSLPFQTPGYEHLELSTQCVIAEALSRGIQVEVLNASTQFIRLIKGPQVEYVKEATKTSLDSYVTSEILGDKWVAKQLLMEANIAVPDGVLCDSVDSAWIQFERFSDSKLVIKPTSTNYGIGITILDSGFSRDDFIEGVRRAFSHDNTLLLETFLEGIECRFLVIDFKTVAVLHRVPANVVGDGTHSIQELVELKNQDSRRGKGYKTPLEKMEIGEVEQGVLAADGWTETGIPHEGEQVFLRKNSNISTGGDSLDYTDQVHASYFDVAEQAAKVANARICGVDMMLSAYASPATPDNHGLIELNYNPVLYFHDFPYEGKNRHTARAVLDALGF